MTHEMTTRVNAHVCGYISWFVPEKVSFNAIPRAFTLMTEMEPTREQTPI